MSISHSLKKIFYDDPIARTKRIYFWCYYFLGAHVPFLNVLMYHWYVRHPIKVGKDGRVPLLHVEADIVIGCNMRCEYCSHFSPLRKGAIPADELIESFTLWRKKIKPAYFILLGGEPLLHPECARIIRESRHIWDDSKLSITTNGLLLKTVKIEVLDAIKETDCELVVTEHTFEPQHREMLDEGYKRLKQLGVKFIVRPSNRTWSACHQYGPDGKPTPYKGDPKKAWYICGGKIAIALADNKLYKCSYFAPIEQGVKEGILNREDWKDALTYQPLTVDSTPEEIVKHLRTSAIKECAVCPDKKHIVEPTQLPR